METNSVLPNNHIERSAVQLKPIDAIYVLYDNYDLCGVLPLVSLNQPLPFDPPLICRVFFNHSDTPHEIKYLDEAPYADIFCQSNGQFCIEYNFLPLTSAREIECLEALVTKREFLSPALKRWGIFRLRLRSRGAEVYHQGANMLVDYYDGLGAAYLRRVGLSAGMTFVEVVSDYQFLRALVNRLPGSTALEDKLIQQMIHAYLPQRELPKLVVDDDKPSPEPIDTTEADAFMQKIAFGEGPSPEPIDTSDSDAYIRSFFEK